MFTYWSLSDSKSSPQISMNFLSILVDLKYAVIWIISSRSFISKSSCSCTNPSVTIERTNYNWYNRHFHVPWFFQFPCKVQILISLLFSLNFTRWSAGTEKSTIWHVLFCFCWQSLGLVVWPRLGDLFVSQNPCKVCVSFSNTGSWLCTYYLFLLSKLKFLVQFPVDHFSPPSRV